MTSSTEFEPELLINGPAQASRTIVLAHGAGVGMDSEFMDTFSKGLAERDIRVVRFEFPYMSARRKTGKRRPPDREPILRETWLRIIESLGAEGLVIGGKSMGGRIASLIADEADVAGLVCLGYPYHPSGKPDKLRTEHLGTITTPTLIVQGERDTLGNKAEVTGYELSKKIKIHWLPDGDHSFKPRKASGRTLEENWTDAVEVVVNFMLSISDD